VLKVRSTLARVTMFDGPDRGARLRRIQQLFDEYRAAKRRRIARRAMRLWRAAEARQRLARFEEQPERVH
jgi:hypothetical protein